MCQSGFYETDLFRDNVKVKRCADVPINKSNNIWTNSIVAYLVVMFYGREVHFLRRPVLKLLTLQYFLIPIKYLVWVGNFISRDLIFYSRGLIMYT